MSRYSTEKLIHDMAFGPAGPARAAEFLLQLDSEARRERAVGEAYTLMNLMGFRYSEALSEAVAAIKRAVFAGTEERELYGELTARLDRERQQAQREARDYALRMDLAR